MLRDLMTLSMSSSIKLTAEKLLAELRTTNLGNEPSFGIGVHFEGKNSLKSLQPFTKYLRLTLVFLSNSTLREKFNFCFSRVF